MGKGYGTAPSAISSRASPTPNSVPILNAVGFINQLSCPVSPAVCTAQFSEITYTESINQNRVSGDAIVTVQCTVAGEVEYSIESFDPADTELATIDGSTGVISLAINAIDLPPGSYTISLHCQDVSQTDGDVSSALLQVTRVEENEHPPEFVDGDMFVSILESRDIDVNSFVAQFTATDADLGTFGSVVYSLTVNDTFTIDPQTGTVTLTASLDYDTDPTHIRLVMVSNPGPVSGSSDAALLTVTVLDVNDEPPVFSEASYSVVVAETTTDTPIPEPGFFTVSCTDPDSADSGITYAALSDSSPFLVDLATGNFSITENLDYEMVTSYTFTVGCWDNGSPNLTTSVSVDIVVGSVNEYRPRITNTRYLATVGEGDPTGTQIYNVTAVDKDSGPDGVITFTIANTTDTQFLDIDIYTGVVFVAAPEDLDFDALEEDGTFHRFDLDVVACDTHPPVPECEGISVIVFLLGVNEDPPEFTEERYSVSYPENTPPGTTVTTASCSDTDRGTGRFCRVTLSETAGSHISDTFHVDNDTGEVITLVKLDYENQTSYGFELVCLDTGSVADCGGPEVMTDRAIVEVAVEPLNDNLPRFAQSSYTFNVSRTTPPDRRTVGVASASDADVGVGGDLEFSLAANGFFDITDEGEVQIFNSVFNYSTSSIVSTDFLTITVDVSDGTNEDRSLIIIYLTEGNLNPPEFLPGIRAIEVSELSPVDTSVISLSCEDPDTGVNGEIRYSITDGNTNQAFKVDQLTGEVSVNNILVLPQNTSNVDVTLTITCEDRGVPVFSDLASVFIRIYQDDSLPPQFPNDTIIAFVSEDAEFNHLVTTVEAIDLDSEQLVYRFEDQSVPGVFTIGISTAEVIVSAPLDRETTSVYTMTVVATEERQTPGPERSDNTSLIIYVRDVNDNTPHCSSSSLVATIPETQEVGSTVIQLNCSDPDAGDNGDIEYSLINDFGVLAISDVGRISLNQSLSLTTQNTLVLTIDVSDKGSPRRQQTVRATVFISSVNHNTPTFTNIPATIKVSEAQAIQTVFFSVVAEDPDRGSFGEVTYQIVNSTSDDDIGIFPNTGGIFLNRKLNFFERNEYLLNISAADSDFTVTELLTILVLDANEFIPECQQVTITAQIQEGLPAGQLLTPSLSCSDDDIGSNGEVVFSIVSGNEGDVFEVQSDGSFRTLQTLDFDNGTRRYELGVNVSDSGSPPRSIEVTTAVVVEAVNEFSPEFEDALYSTSFDETSSIGSSVLQLTATDDDAVDHAHGRLDYEIQGLPQPVFQVTSTGELQVAGVLDREERSTYNFIVKVSDEGIPPLSSETNVEIEVTDVDDNGPVFTEDIYVAILNGTTEEGTPVITVECTDLDEGTNAGIAYSFVDGNDAQFFSIDMNGMIQVDEDLPVSDIYSISVTCMGTGPGGFADTTVVSIQVLVDTNITFIPSSDYSIQVPEDTVAGRPVLTVQANSSSGAQLYYELVDSANPFSISETTGVLQLRGVLNYETTQTYTLQVRASDNGSPPNFGDAIVQVLIVNVNDETPIITTQPITITIEEEDGEVIPRIIAEYQCTDNDAGVFGEVSFVIRSGNSDQLFSLSSSGILQLLQALDYEAAQSHSLEVVCEDGGEPPDSDTITVSITVSPINDNPPTFSSDTFEILVTESLPSGSQVGDPIEATDIDLSLHGNIRYSIESGNDPRTFALSSETGQLSLVQSLDYETTISYSLVILARDSGGQVEPDFPVLSDTVTVQVTVLDYNDNIPHFELDTYSGTISEMAQNGDQVSLAQDISCTDADSGERAEVSLSIVEDSPFTIEGSGLVTVSASELLDFELQQLFILTVTCRDNGIPQQASHVDLVITVQDVNEFGPEFNVSSYTLYVPESTVVGTTVGEVFASDLDAGDAGTISYSLRNMSDIPFDINTDSGAIVLARSLDYETQSTSYILQVEAADASTLSDIATVIVVIENEDDNNPLFTQDVYYETVRENALVDTLVSEVDCSDADDAADGLPISYSLTDEAVPFAIDGSGRVTVAGDLDLELTPRYTFQVNCSDSAQNVAHATLSINLLPFNDFPPVLQGSPPYTRNLAENPTIGTIVFEVQALDDDLTLYNEITYSFSGGNEDGRFSISPASGDVTTADLIDREVQETYILDVVARNEISADDESGSLPLSATTTLTVTVTDINDNDPSIQPSSVTVVLQVSVSANATVVDFDCTDADSGENGQTDFSITSQQFTDRFDLSDNGVLRTTDVIDENVVVIVTCADNGTPRRSSSARVVIETVSMNEHDPVFPGATVRTIEVREDAEVGEEIGCFQAMDADGSDTPDGNLEYSLIVDGTDNRFTIQRDTGCVIVALVLDYDETNFYQYTVTADDMGDPPRSASITLQITILDTVRDPPVVVGIYTRSIPETVGGGTHIVDFLCEDTDNQDVVRYSIIGGNSIGLFVIDRDSGRIEVAPGQVLDYESSTAHTLLVECIDTYNLTDSDNVFINVNPVNEFTPSFEAAQYHIPEHSIGGTVVANLQWEDLDSGRDGEVEFEILSGDPQGVFLILSSGRLLVNGVLNREAQDKYDLEITITDLSDTLSERRNSFNYVTVTLTDINDNRPQFTQELYIFGTLQGDEDEGYTLGVVSCSDDDLGANAETEYGISSTSSDARLFSVNSTGHITLTGSLSTRVFDNITFFVQCIDSGSRPMVGTALVIVPVMEENFFPPVFSSTLYSAVWPENTPIISEVLLTVQASDMDIGVNGRIQYSLVDDFNNTFFIDDTSGELSLLRSLNFEAVTYYELVAVATDGTQDSRVRLVDYANITINVTGVNEFSPFCPDPIYVTIINKTTTGAIVDLDCVDDDAGSDGEISYLITSGNEDSLFTLSETGVISVPTAIQPINDIEQYPLNINVTDMGDPDKVTQVEVIAIYSFDNLDDPDFNETEYFISVSELTEVGTIVATLTAMDSDPSLQGVLQYSLEGVSEFRIDSESGQLFLSSPLDFEEQPELSFIIVAEDSDPYEPLSGSAMVRVAVRNENDNSPRCSQQLYSASTLSTGSVGELVLRLNCSDPDGNPITYSPITPQSSFGINSTTGEVTITGPLTPGTTTVFDVSVTDMLQSTKVSVSVSVRFSNTERPSFSQNSYNFTVSEDTALLVTVGTLAASDDDSSELTFSARDSVLSEFYISPSSGDVLLTVPLDFETTTSYSFEVVVTDSGSHDGTNRLTDTATVMIAVENTNDNSPQFSDGGIYGALVSKTTAEGTQILDVQCTDQDASPYGSPVVSSNGFSTIPFDLVNAGSDYAVQVAQTLLVSKSYFVNITCTDEGGDSVEGQVFIFVPEPDAPTFSENIYEWLLSENTETGAEFTDLSATSSDDSDVRYDISDGNPDSVFYIDPSTGVVSLVSTLDYETQQTHGLIVRARDGENRESRVLLLVQVLDINDQVPLTPPSARLQVTQSSPVGFPMGALECSDGETQNGTVFNFTFIPASDLFSVDTFGVVRLEGELDATPVHVLPVICFESDMPEAVSTGIVTVEVVFVNNYAPEFEFSSYVFSISEDVSTLTYLGTVNASDSDVGSFGEVSYSITDGNPDKFFIEASTGRIGVLTSLDREETDSYTLTVTAVDGGASAAHSTRRNGSALVLVQIEDANDNTPTAEHSSYVESITTDHAIHSPVLSVVCSDSDLSDAGAIHYSLEPLSVPFSIQTNGTVILDEVQPNQAVYTFDVVCADSELPVLSSSALVTVIVDSVELEAPVFDRSQYNVTVSENEPIQTTILRVHATPSDASVGIGYQLQSGNTGNQFQVDPSTGDVIIRNPLDASEQQYYTLTIRATNTGRNPLSSFTTVDVIVTDINDHSPVFSTPFYAASVTETDPSLTPVAQVSCTDEDITAEISYSITGGLGEPPVFNITQEGLVATSGGLDYEMKTVYNLVVVCSDGGPTPRTAEATVRVEIIPVNEFVPVFEDQQYVFSAEENSFGTRIGYLLASDSDDGIHGEVTYLLQDPGNFSVVFVGPTTGEVLVSNNLDFEMQTFWNLTVIARDGAGAESFVPLLILVTNVNDVLPEVTPATSIATIPHDTVAGYPLQTYSCTDGDYSLTSLSIASGNDLGYFTLNSLNQLIWNGMAENLLTSIVVSLSLECVDDFADEQRVLAYTAVTIQVGDLLPPEFSSEVYEMDVPENREVGLSIVNVTATRDGHTIEYSLDELFASLPFAVEPQTGFVRLTSSLNRENTSYYVFPVHARDVETDAVGVALVAVTVTDINDNPPVITPEVQSLGLSEAMALDLPFAIFRCSDNDEGQNGDTVFFLMPPNPFTISEGGQVSISTPLNFEEQSQHNITVTCSDRGSPPQSISATLLVEVTGTNEHPPMFLSATYSFSILEGEVLGTLVGVVSATDSDLGGQLQYQLIGGNGIPYFTVNSLGEVRTSSLRTNATQSSSLDLIVEASDGLLSGVAVVNVSVADVNEAPLFQPPGGVLALWYTSAPVGGTILEVLCYDRDTPPNAMLTLSLLSNPSSLPLSLRTLGSEGFITANDMIPAGTYTFSLLCSDGALNTTSDVTLRVEGVNNPPVFEHGDLAFALLESTVPGTSLVNVSATDPEGTGVTYSISSGTGLGTFNIDPLTGQISLALFLDFEVTEDYLFTVTATDNSRFDRKSSSIDIFVYVININDVPPSLSPTGSVILTLSENSPPTTPVKMFDCSDPEGGVALLSLTPSYHEINSPFDISSEGVVILLAAIDYERVTDYRITVTCTDTTFTGGDVTFQQSATLSVHITPENNFSPEFDSEPEFEVPEDATVGAEIGRVHAIDRDYRDGTVITYTLLTHLDTFVLESESGLITLREELDFESVLSYLLSVEASDNDNTEGTVTPRTNTTDITVSLTDVNDNSPTCAQYLVNIVVPTGIYSNRYLAQLLCSDRDSGENGLLVYSFIEDTLPSFESGTLLLNSSTGELEFSGVLTQVQTVVVDVNVSDSGLPRREARVTLTIQIQSSSLTEPRFNISTFNTTIPEDTPVDTVIFSGSILFSSLHNPNDDSVTFILRLNEAHGRVFIINSVTGDISITGESPLDFDEGLQEYNLIVEALVGSFTPTAIVSVFLTDVNDNAPRFGLESYLGVVLENQPVGSSVATVSAEDIDSGSNGEFLYSISDSNNFHVHPETGEVTTVRVLDREALPTDSVTVTATDSGSPPLSSNTIVSITIADENDVTPRFLQDLYIININNVSPPGTQLQTLTVNDEDEVGEFVFRIFSTDEDSDALDLFAVVSPDGVLIRRSVSIPMKHRLQYRFSVEVNDGIRTATTDVIINIVTVTAASLHILENQPYSFDLKVFLRERTFNLTDAATFSFLNGNELMDFTISTDGNLTTLGLDRESVPEYDLNINVTDLLSDTVANVLVTIDVEDVNDHVPVFPGTYTFSVNESTYVASTYLGTVTATDQDDPTTRNARLLYSLVEPNIDQFFVTTTGDLYLMGTFDREDQEQHRFTVRAEDFGEPDQGYGYVDVIVNIIDRNDNNPQFVPPDVVEFFVEVEFSDKDPIGPGSVLSNIVAVLPVARVTLDQELFAFFDPDATSTLNVSLSVLQGTDKYKLEPSDPEGDDISYMLVATDFIKSDDTGTILQITLSDDPKEENPIIRNVTILVTEITEPAETPTVETPKTEELMNESAVNFFTSEIGIAVIVMIVLLGLAVLLLCGCLVFYCILKYKRSKDPLRARYGDVCYQEHNMNIIL